jgi:helicase SWR1
VGADEDDFGEVASAAERPGSGGDAMVQEEEAEEDQGGTVVDYMIARVEQDWDHFSEWRV